MLFLALICPAGASPTAQPSPQDDVNTAETTRALSTAIDACFKEMQTITSVMALAREQSGPRKIPREAYISDVTDALDALNDCLARQTAESSAAQAVAFAYFLSIVTIDYQDVKRGIAPEQPIVRRFVLRVKYLKALQRARDLDVRIAAQQQAQLWNVKMLGVLQLMLNAVHEVPIGSAP